MVLRPILVTAICCLMLSNLLLSEDNSHSAYFNAGISNSFLEGHVISQYYASSLFECSHFCVNNFQCLSFNFKSTLEEQTHINCHLNDVREEDCPMDMKTYKGYRYFELSFVDTKISRATSPKKCINVDKQESCPIYDGACSLLSCSDYLSRNPDTRSGIYRLFVTNSTETFSVFCDFQLDSVWTLVMSWKLENNVKYENKPLYEDFPQRNNEFNFDDYRLSLKQMQAVKSKSFFWKMTCNFQSETEDSDMVLASFQDFDILTTDTGPNGTCLPFFSINVRNYSCEPCSALFIQTQGVAPHVASTQSAAAGCTMNITGVEGEQNFGKYAKINPEFGCTNLLNSTTQIWFGL